MQGVVQEFGQSRNNKPKVKISGKWYSAGRTDISKMNLGMPVEFSGSEFATNQWGINEWKPAQANSAYNNQRSGGPTRNASNGSEPSTPLTVSTITEVDVLRSVSNVVGSACAAGTVKSPEELEKWFTAAWCGLTRMEPSKERIPGADDDFNDELPQGFSQRPDPKSF